MNNIYQMAAMALGESSMQVKYNGNKNFAAIVIDADGGAGFSPLVSVGVSNTSVAQAITNAITAFTGLTTSTLDDLIHSIKNVSGGTIDADDEISIGDFDCRVKDNLKTQSIYDGSTAEFADEAGTAQNLRGFVDGNTGSAWFSTLVRDNDVATSVARVDIRVPRPDISQGGCTIRSITGISSQAGGTAISNGLVREILDDEGNVLWTYSDASPTAAEGKFDLEAAIGFGGPVVIRERCLVTSDFAELDLTTTTIAYAIDGNG